MTRTRKLARPVRIGRTWIDPTTGRSIPVVAGGGDVEGDPDPAPEDDADVVEVPEDLTDRDAIADEALVTFEDALVAEFDRLIEEGSKDVARLNDLAGEIERVRAEQERRVAVDAETQAEIDALADRIRPKADADPEPDPEGDDEPEAGADDKVDDDKAPEKAEPVAAKTADPVVASGAAAPRKRVTVPPASAVRRAAPAQTPPPARSDDLVVITAAADVPTFGLGQALTAADLPQAMYERAKNLPDRSGKVNVATISRPVQFVGEREDPTAVLDALVASMTTPQAGGTGAAALVASGGWCAPIRTFMELFAIEGTDAMFDLPTIGIEGAGINVPSFIGFDAADQSLWTWTAANDEAIRSDIANLALASNVLTVDTDTNHGLAVGNKVRFENLSDSSWTFLNGEEVTVATVTDANTFTAAYTHANVTTEAITEGRIKVFKPHMRIPCPTWTEYELEAEGLSIEHGNMTNRAWPALGQRYVNLAMAAHERRMRARALQKVIATISGTDTITLTDVGSDAAGELLAGVDLATMSYRDQYGMSMNTVLECVFPLWVPNAIRATLARRAGVDMLSVPTSQIVNWFVERNVRPQFVRDYQDLYTSGGGPLVFPATVQFLIFPAGGYFMGTGGSIDLGAQRDRTLNEQNDFTLAWMEEFYLVGQRGPDGRLVTVSTGYDGVTACCA